MLIDVMSLILIYIGAFFVFSAAVGVARFPDTMSRVQAVTKPQTTGLILLITGTILRVLGGDNVDAGVRGDMGMLVLLVVFALMTSPISAQRLGRISRREGLYGDEANLLRNEAPADIQGVRSKKS